MENNNETLTLILNCFCCQMNNNGVLLIAAHLYQVKNAGDCFWHHERILIASWICTTSTSNIHPNFSVKLSNLLEFKNSIYAVYFRLYSRFSIIRKTERNNNSSIPPLMHTLLNKHFNLELQTYKQLSASFS